MRYQVHGADGSSVEVDAVDWMMAMAKAIAQLGIEVSGWACQTRPDGSVVVVDPMSGRSWEVRAAGPSERTNNPVIEGRTVSPATPTSADDLVAQTTPPQAPALDATPTPQPLRSRPSAPTVADFGSLSDEDDLALDALDPPPEPTPPESSPPESSPPESSPVAPVPSVHAAPTVALPEAPKAPPALHMPRPSAPAPRSRTVEPRPAPVLRPRPSTGPDPDGQSTPSQSTAPKSAAPAPSQAPDDLAERLFDLSMELSAASDGPDACRRALDLCLQLVPCEAGSVLRGGLNDAHLTFVAVAGPAAQLLLNQRLPYGEGIVGASFDLGITIGVEDVAADPRHASDFDQKTGFRTRAVLCVPVQGRRQYHGAVQLLNPMDGAFAPWHRDAVEQLAASLASTLDAFTPAGS